jgi:hypothetical protein|tara:strand:+ start:156 stop:836 length:681 start_codon:yes stop_codon:yes gene_type:complete
MKDVRHSIMSQCWSVDDDPAAQAFDGWEYVLKSVRVASQCRIDCDASTANAFPGDHYRILAGLIYNLDRSNGPLSLIDIGTSCGLSARTMLDYSPDEDKVETFDVANWLDNPTTYLTEKDFETRLTQHIQDLKETEVFSRYAKMLCEADFIMCDGPKDGEFEMKFYTLLSTLDLPKKPRWLLLDDIRFPSEMVSWRMIDSPKIDLTSFGHFSGTGLVNISEGLKFG